jgi:hypothetical protein
MGDAPIDARHRIEHLDARGQSCETARGVFMAHNPKGYANCIAVEMKDDINYADLGTIS